MTYRAPKPVEKKEEYLLVDGYNIIFAWKELKELSDINMDGAKGKLMDALCNYQGIKKCQVIVVFDAYRVAGHKTEIFDYHNIHVVYTKEAETADAYIEKFAHENGRKYHVTVATSDSVEQTIIFNTGALRLSALQLEQELYNIDIDVKNKIKENNLKNKSFNFYRMHDSELKK
jgi:predicted RNA-binding protein with PIN domain